jgi:predicted choloylglycine hydrolase
MPKTLFSRISFTGQSYDTGYALGGLLEQNPGLRRINVLSKAVNLRKLEKKITVLQEFCPSVVGEANGVADKLKIPVGSLAIFSDRLFTAGACSHFAMLPPITNNGHLLVGRSYEFSTRDEKNFAIIKADGYPAHIGFSLFLFGRFDGMNEHGLTVTMSSCEFGQPSHGDGLWFPFVLRAILDRCSKVDEAVYLLKHIPVRCCTNIIIADQYGKAVLAEIACYGNDRTISFRNGDAFLVSTNHYTNSDMLKYDNHHGKHSELRYRAIEKMITQEKGSISESSIKALLSAKIPDGLACHYYKNNLGTLHSMVFDATARKVDICFGSPAMYPFEPASFDEPSGTSVFSVAYNNEHPDNPKDFWQILPRGELT